MSKTNPELDQNSFKAKPIFISESYICTYIYRIELNMYQLQKMTIILHICAPPNSLNIIESLFDKKQRNFGMA